MKTFAVFVIFIVLSAARHQGQEEARYYLNEWVVRVEGGSHVAELLAIQMGYKFKGQVVGFRDTYRMIKDDHPVERKRGQPWLTERLANNSHVVWAEQQFVKQRQKRGFVPDFQHKDDNFFKLEESEPTLNDIDCDLKTVVNRRFNDELWDQQWYMQDTRTYPNLPKLDLHVLPCYDLGVTGKGVRVSILDDGIEYTHQDLRDNYDPEISYDANEGDTDPAPRYDSVKSNAHGTRCAGEVAMKANNGKCGVGVAYNARIGGVRLLDGDVNDLIEGIALGYAYNKVDIYSASWGPNDDGKTVEGPGNLAMEAIERGIREGRNGRGVIYVWAAGNGGSKDDNCDCDGYIGSIYTLSIGSASQQGQFPWYGERCAATMATTYSSGAYSDQMIATTDLGNSCTIKHTGTSASAPLAAGIIALALEVNSNLTWRDVQHLVAWTSEYDPLRNNEGWLMNAAGYWVNTRFGFGLMNAFGLVKAAAKWVNVPKKYICSVEIYPFSAEKVTLYYGKNVTLLMDATACEDINYLEHVELEVNIEYPIRGDLEIYLTSPLGTKIQLLSRRQNDKSKRGFKNWKLMSVLTWNENPQGVWNVLVTDQGGTSTDKGRIGKFILHLHGTEKQPRYLANGKRQYNLDYNRLHKKMASSEDRNMSPENKEESDEWQWSDLVDLGYVLSRERRFEHEGIQ